MNPNAKQYIILFLIAFRWASVLAQIPTNYSYEYYNSSHGLASSEIISLAKDNDGFLWIGTAAGLSRYDGYEFQNYSLTKENDRIGFVNVIVMDEQKRLWIGSDAGLFCYENEEIIKVSATSSSPQGVNDILLENNGNIWLATENGPAKIQIPKKNIGSIKKMVLSDFVIPEWKFKNADIDTRRLILVEKSEDGTLYFAQFTNLFRLADGKMELIHSMSNSRDQIMSVSPMSKSTVLFFTVITEIHKIENGVHTNIQFKEMYQPGVDDNLPGIWFHATFGLYYFHPQTGVLSRFINMLEQNITWSTNMLQDDNFFWFATHEGLVKIKPSIFTLYNVDSVFSRHRDYYGITQLKDNSLLFGSNRGNLLKKNDAGFELIYKNIVSGAELKSLYEDDRGWLWMATGYQGLIVVKDKKPLFFTVENGLHDNSFSHFLKTSNGKLYAIGDQGMTEIIVGSDESISFRKYSYFPNISKHAKFLAGIEGPDQTLWIGGEEGVHHLVNDSLRLFHIDNKHISVRDMIKDMNGNVWIATDGDGILKCKFTDKNELELIKQLNEKDGLNTLNYLSLLADKENNIWAGSSRGLTFLGQHGKLTGHIVNFDEYDGFIKPGSYFTKLFEDKSGRIWIGSTFGLASFKPDQLFLSTVSPTVHISSIRQMKSNESISPVNNSKRFSYDNNSLSFSFVALDYANQKGIRYFYKLEGLDTNWIAARNSRSVTYGNLPPNNYTFRVKALNNKGISSQQDAVYSFIITSPFWKTWWFLLSAITILTLVAILLFRRRIAMIKTKADIQRQLMALEIRALRSQMNPHFIFNSLNSISQLVASKRNEEGLQYLSKFSKLLRLVLNQSEKSFIPLKDEILILDLYLQLETLRFGSSFSYTIHTDDSLDEEEILVPSFLIHPIIENAIWHGLLHKDGERRLIINFQGKDKDKLICIVKDNGIGIEAAALKKQQQLNGEKQPSKGLKMVKERLALLDEQNNGTTNFKLEDMKDDNGYISGTKCTIELPVIYE